MFSRMMNFDRPVGKKDKPDLNPDGSVEFNPLTDVEKEKYARAFSEGQAINEERGGSGVLPGREARMLGEAEPSPESGWALGLEMQESMQTSPLEQENGSISSEERLADIEKKLADIASRLIAGTNETEKAGLEQQRAALLKGRELYRRKLSGESVTETVMPEDEKLAA